jgi:hypothetical protein
MSTVCLALTVIFSIGVLFSTRRVAALGVMATVCYITIGHQFVVAGLNLTALRIVLMVGLVRIIIRGELRDLKLNRIDRLLIAFLSVVTLFATLRESKMEVLIYQCGVSYNILLSYFLFRIFLNNCKNVDEFLHSLASLIAPLAIFMIVQSITGTNFLPGSFDLPETYIRGGRIRCQGNFLGPITAGIFGATLMPMFVSILGNSDRHCTAIIGVLSAIAITYTSNSSGPLMAFLTGLMGLVFWQLRERMKMVRWGIVAALLCLIFIMEAPIWYLPAKIGGLTGGDGWHRSYLINQAIRFFPDWWLLGTSETGHWMPYSMSWGGADITNQYILAGIDGGLVGLILFVLIIIFCFKNIGMALRQSRTKAPSKEFFFWCLGSVLFAHVVTFFSVTYFDQMGTVWWAFIGIISSTTSDVLRIDHALQTESRRLNVVRKIDLGEL